MNIEPTECNTCPLMANHMDGWGGAHCNHPKTEGYDLHTFTNNIVPEWCELKSEPITITLKQEKIK